jgi:adenylosuccinate synthase
MATAVLGLQWGDEGKGKMTHLLARGADVVVRFNGGPNAGHTVIDRGVKFGTHLIPAGAFHRGTVSILAGGMVIDLDVLAEEVRQVAAHTGETPRLLVAENAHLILPYHRLLEELEGSGARFGTTRRGISPAYRDKVAHTGVRVGDLLRPDELTRRIAWRLELLKRIWPESEEMQEMDAARLTEGLLKAASPLLDSIGDAASEIRRAMQEGRRVLFEGAQGTLLDVDHGTYPYVTSSSTTIGGLASSLGLPPSRLSSCVGVAKAYLTRVGEGPFPTELTGDDGEELRQRGGEYGVTTGRPRRCGWLDAVALRYAVELNGVTELALTKLDILTGIEEIKICVAYRVEGREIASFPPAAAVLERCEPVYETHPGWADPIRLVKRFADLPENARAYVRRIDELCGAPTTRISVGPSPEETLVC